LVSSAFLLQPIILICSARHFVATKFWCDLVEVERCRTSFAWCGNRKKELDLRRLRFETCKMNDIDPKAWLADLLPWNRRSERRQSAVAA